VRRSRCSVDKQLLGFHEPESQMASSRPCELLRLAISAAI
jgi:hypothetical protein